MFIFKDEEIMNTMQDVSAFLVQNTYREFGIELPDNTITYDCVYNAAKIWIDLSCIPYYEHDAILKAIESAASYDFEYGNIRHAPFMIYEGPKLARALHSYNIGFNMEIESHGCIDHSCDEYQFAMHIIELKKWLRMNVHFVKDVFVVPLDAEGMLYGFVCKFKPNRIADHICKNLVNEKTKTWMQLFHDTNATFRYSEPESDTEVQSDGMHLQKTIFCAAFTSPGPNALDFSHSQIMANMHWVSLEELGLIA